MKIEVWVCQLEYSKCTKDNRIHGNQSGCGEHYWTVKCNMPGCKEEHGVDRWSRGQAYKQGRYHDKNIDYCPAHANERMHIEYDTSHSRRDSQGL